MQLPLFWLCLIALTCFLGINVAAAQDRMRVAIPLFPTAAFPLLVASDRGFFQREGLTVEPIRINSAPTNYQALSGDVHGAVDAPTGLLASYSQGADITTVGSWDNFVPYVWLTRERINDVRELRGKRIGVNRAGSKPWLIIQVPLDGEVIDFAYDYLHANSEPTLYPPADAVENLIRMSGYMDKKLQSISAKQVVALSVLDELGTKQNERVHR